MIKIFLQDFLEIKIKIIFRIRNQDSWMLLLLLELLLELLLMLLLLRLRLS